MKLKHLESALCSFDGSFANPKIYLEQYDCPAALAARVAWSATERGDLTPGCRVVDLGAGPGMLGISAAVAMEGEVWVTAIDIDEDAMGRAIENVEEMGLDDTFEFVRARVRHSCGSDRGGKCGGRGEKRGIKKSGRSSGRLTRSLPNRQSSSEVSPTAHPLRTTPADDGVPLATGCADVVFVNPPFGTKNNAGIDVSFLRTAARLSCGSVYSFHKSSTRDYMMKVVHAWDMGCEVVAEMKFEIPATYDFHTRRCVDVEVDLIRIWHMKKELEEIVDRSKDVEYETI
eukprot:CAMPEP_0194296036 /NCGR_PEP_ID=MMETSP0169-20130528/55014_1 /TAXON_ID=218684 /ORGANISM="Corethron pennatum, Strain L29A3" /LENGTH=286 /DNA_ID=CAMNT_0039045371 /DNA_START=53 /DNA_END=913 /DNA_ORIENTATION=+